MKDNEYFNRFLQYIMANLAAAIVYFLSAALISLGGMPDEAASRLLSAVVTALPFALAVFVATLRDKSLPRGYWAKTRIRKRPKLILWTQRYTV